MELTHVSTKQLKELHTLIATELMTRGVRIPCNNHIHNAARLVRYSDYGTRVDDVLASLEEVNSHRLLSLRKSELNAKPNDKLKYLPSLLRQDWSFLFSAYSKAPGHFYVYAHCDPSARAFAAPINLGGACSMPFYVGKGVERRAWDMKRNQGHGKMLSELLGRGYEAEQIVHLFASNLSEASALELESKLIYFFGTIYEKDRRGILLNLDTGKRPAFSGEMQKVPARSHLRLLLAEQVSA